MRRFPGGDRLFGPKRFERAAYVQLGLGVIVAAGSGVCAEGYSSFAVAQSGPLFILLAGVVVATATGGALAGGVAAGASVGLAVLFRGDFAPGVSAGDFALITAAFLGTALLATTLYDGVARSYREANRAHEEARRASNELLTHLREREEFLGLLSHEMRTPMTQILGNARALDRRADSFSRDEIRTAVRDICDQSERLHAMLENMLVLSRLERGAQIEGEPVLVQRVAAETVQDFREQRRGREVRTEFGQDLPPVIGQPGYIAQLVTNLLSNADKYSPAEPPIDLAVTGSDPFVTITVMDRGAGISPEDAVWIYEPYHRLPDTPATSAGVGLGLTVCKRVAEGMGGRSRRTRARGRRHCLHRDLPAMQTPRSSFRSRAGNVTARAWSGQNRANEHARQRVYTFDEYELDSQPLELRRQASRSRSSRRSSTCSPTSSRTTTGSSRRTN
jgi:K+-sensing histidine kinase KdpD